MIKEVQYYAVCVVIILRFYFGRELNKAVSSDRYFGILYRASSWFQGTPSGRPAGCFSVYLAFRTEICAASKPSLNNIRLFQKRQAGRLRPHSRREEGSGRQSCTWQ